MSVRREFVGVVVAAGEARRFGGATPKQFLDLGGRSILERSIELLSAQPEVKGVTVVLPGKQVDGSEAGRARRLEGVERVVPGGATRAESVLRGVRDSLPAEFVLVHDAARPLASPGLVRSVIRATERWGAAVPVLEVTDTVKETDDLGRLSRTLDRRRLRLAQTPQGARVDWLIEALEAAGETGELTDESAALERAGRKVALVPGEPTNLKITLPEDLENARRMIVGGGSELRVGSGFDIHRFGTERRLVLGGVEFPGEPGLEGHSDADVVLHAVMDALLGAAALGDIGMHFPPEDPGFAGADSAGLASRVAGLLAGRGFDLVNLDLTVLAERPRIRRQAARMRDAIADCLRVSPARVSVKATTLESLGALGRGEGIACQAVALVRFSGAPE